MILGQLPFWMLMNLWFLQRRRRGITKLDYEKELAELRRLRGSLPVPTNLLETWLVRLACEWLDRQELDLLTLRLAGVAAVGILDR